MKKLFTLLCLFILLLITSCDKEYACSAGDPNIIGATCNDNSPSSATGSGACSHHGGVKNWRCRD